ncbi:MAG: tetratricopeptide repeat protein [Bryobacterales bacterium]|nr:tetratricopeptide repeat protein [Bryobacterales bacterium]
MALDRRIPRVARRHWLSGATALIALGSVLRADVPDPLLAATEALVSGSPKSAAETLVPVVEADPENADAHRLLGVALSLLGRRSGALEALAAAARLQAANPANHLALAQALAQFGENRRAQESFRAALDLDGRLGPAHEGLALSLALDGSLTEAILHFGKALEHSQDAPAKARLHFFRGKARQQFDRIALAAEDFKLATELQPDHGPAYLEWGRILAEDPDGTSAGPVLEKAAELLPESAEAQFAHGQQLLRHDNPEAAARVLRQATSLNPGDRAAQYALGRALRASGQADEARRVLGGIAASGSDRALEEARINEAGQLNNQGLQAETDGNFELALQRYEAAAAIAPDEVGFHRNAALALCRLNRWVEAKARLREVLRKAPGDPDATKALYIALDHAPD